MFMLPSLFSTCLGITQTCGSFPVAVLGNQNLLQSDDAICRLRGVLVSIDLLPSGKLGSLYVVMSADGSHFMAFTDNTCPHILTW